MHIEVKREFEQVVALAGKRRFGGQVKLAVLHLEVSNEEVGAVAWLGRHVGGSGGLRFVVLGTGWAGW